jgi:hypothetical protein
MRLLPFILLGLGFVGEVALWTYLTWYGTCKREEP